MRKEDDRRTVCFRVFFTYYVLLIVGAKFSLSSNEKFRCPFVSPIEEKNRGSNMRRGLAGILDNTLDNTYHAMGSFSWFYKIMEVNTELPLAGRRATEGTINIEGHWLRFVQVAQSRLAYPIDPIQLSSPRTLFSKCLRRAELSRSELYYRSIFMVLPFTSLHGYS